jgi:XTP/dITP diphosphohydrolase
MNELVLLFASSNSGKLVEVREVAAGYGITVRSPNDVDADAFPGVDESAADYAGNALLKAEAYGAWSRLPAFADDTGLEVAALDGAPGLYSARYAGEPVDFRRNIAKLLSTLEGQTDRRALFRSVICLTGLTTEPLFSEAVINGTIALTPSGSGGFGYDSVFITDEHGRTLAELKERGVHVKTHRVLALEKLFERIKGLPEPRFSSKPQTRP